MRTGYDILLSLTITHSYFLDKVFENFELIPDKKTTALLKEQKLITKKRNNNWNLFFQTEGPFATTISSLINKEFLFTLEIKDTFFYDVTNDSYLHDKDEMLYFNSPIDSVMVPEKRKVYPLKFNYTIHHNARPVNIKLTTAKGTELINDTIIDETILQKEIDLTLNGENIYNITEDTVPPGSLINEKVFAKEISYTDDFYGTVYFKVLPVDVNNSANQFFINVESNN